MNKLITQTWDYIYLRPPGTPRGTCLYLPVLPLHFIYCLTMHHYQCYYLMKIDFMKNANVFFFYAFSFFEHELCNLFLLIPLSIFLSFNSLFFSSQSFILTTLVIVTQRISFGTFLTLFHSTLVCRGHIWFWHYWQWWMDLI